MELSILVVLLASFILSIDSHPKHFDVIPKDYYKRQILQPIPGYIPVYIQTDEEPLVRSETGKESPNTPPQKAAEPKEKHLVKETSEENLSKNKDEKHAETRTESLRTEFKNQSENRHEKTETTVNQAKEEKQVRNSQVKADDLKA